MLKYNLSMYLADQSKIRESNIRAYGWVIPQLTVAFAVIVARLIMHQPSAQATEVCSIPSTDLAILGIYALAAVGVQSEFARTCVSAPLIVGLSLRYAQLFFTATDHSNHYTIASISLNMPRAIPRMFSRAPDCCGAQMSRRQTSSNYNGNRDRWRYFCRNCPLIPSNHELLLDSAWDDSLGQAAFERAQLDWGDIIYLENEEEAYERTIATEGGLKNLLLATWELTKAIYLRPVVEANVYL
ncbi:hypothetical protein CBS147332_5588 [Penicillium roqueforti]|nr:hypothetical protein CBS147332_5588 [Penicillium roqueforti]KAI3107853.1 hypothetical protein CBS147331_5954 [Penicillium roqueforti]